MNNDLEQFSEERLKKMIFLEGSGCVAYQANEVAALARIALSVKLAVPAGYLENGKGFMYEPRHKELIKNPTPVYGVPPLEIPDGWIKCSEMMPEIEEDYYQTFSSAGVDISYFFEGYFADQNITHWMPLPAAPKPESEW